MKIHHKRIAIVIAIAMLLGAFAVVIGSCGGDTPPEVTTEKPTENHDGAARTEVNLILKIVNDTDVNPPKNTEVDMSILPGWRPDLSSGEDVKTITLEVGKFYVGFVFPDGAEGNAIDFRINATENTQDGEIIAVIISDENVLITGDSLENKVAGFPR